MRAWTTLLMVIGIVLGAATIAPAQTTADERRALRERLEGRYDLVPLTDGLALRPKTRGRDVRLIEVTEGAVLVNGVAATGRELRDRLGDDADAVLRLSYLPADELRDLAAPGQQAPRQEAGKAAVELPEADPALEREAPAPPEERPRPRRRRASGDRIRIFGNVAVEKDEEVTGQAVAVFGSVRVDGEVGDQVVSVFGSVDLGPEAVVRGDVVAVGGRVHRAAGAQTRSGVTEVSLSDAGFPGHFRRGHPWLDSWDGMPAFLSFGALPRLVGTGLRLCLLLLLTGMALIVARRSVDASAQRISDNPLKVTLVGLMAEVLILPVLVLTAIVLSVSIIGIPLLLLLPFVVLLLVLMALVGFTGAAAAIGQAVHRRFAPGMPAGYLTICAGLLVILSPVLLGRLLAVAGWPVTPIAALLIGAGFALELLVWAGGFGAMLTNVFTRWQAQRPVRAPLAAPPTA